MLLHDVYLYRVKFYINELSSSLSQVITKYLIYLKHSAESYISCRKPIYTRFKTNLEFGYNLIFTKRSFFNTEPLTNRARGPYWGILARGRESKGLSIARSVQKRPRANIPQYGSSKLG